MDVRCEKCQTEYELDESRLKPGGVTVKCTNCGHMFKIRKRTPTNVGVPALEAPTVPSQVSANIARDIHNEATRQAPMPQRTPPMGVNRADSVIGDAISDPGSGPTQAERQWLVRLENGEQKTCRELATLQQWIVAGVATRESLISRSGKTWKRLGDIAELSQYFSIADEARTSRAVKPTPKPGASTVLGIGNQPTQPAQPVVRANTPAFGATAAGGTILPDDDDERKTTGNFRQRRTTPPPPPPATPKSTTIPRAPDSGPVAMQQTEISSPKLKPEQRATGTWASSEIKGTDSMTSMPQGPRGGRLGITDNEPAFAGRVRLDPGNESSFQTGKVSRLSLDDDDSIVPPQRGSRAGTWIALLALLVIGVGAGAVYMFVFNKKPAEQAAAKQDAGSAVAVVADASAPIVTSLVDAAPEDPLTSARNELLAGIEPRMKGVYDALATKDDGPSLAMRARLACGLAQSLTERAGLVTDKAESDKLRKDGKQLVVDAAPLAQKALKAAADDPSANLAMADVLRLQGKPLKDVQRYLEAAKTKGAADKELARSIALSDALVLARDAKLDDAQKELVGLDGAGDARVQTELAMIAYAKGKPADAKPFVDQNPDRVAGPRCRARAVEAPRDRGRDHGSDAARRLEFGEEPHPAAAARDRRQHQQQWRWWRLRLARREGGQGRAVVVQLGDADLYEGPRAKAHRRRSVDRARLLQPRREAVRERVLEVPRGAPGVSEVRAGARRRGGDVSAAVEQGEGDRSVARLPRRVSELAKSDEAARDPRCGRQAADSNADSDPAEKWRRRYDGRSAATATVNATSVDATAAEAAVG
ncbi:MAG: zinc-ribbon domain-containing protein [Kofleriaceae bacterium]